jgi:hypothetical protein
MIGVPVCRIPVDDDDFGDGAYEYYVGYAADSEQGVWFSKDKKALAEMREIATEALMEAGFSHGLSDYSAVRMLRALGLDARIATPRRDETRGET